MATMPLRPWEDEASVMAPRMEHGNAAAAAGGPLEGGAGEGLNLYGQVLAWSEDGRYAKAGGGRVESMVGGRQSFGSQGSYLCAGRRCNAAKEIHRQVVERPGGGLLGLIPT